MYFRWIAILFLFLAPPLLLAQSEDPMLPPKEEAPKEPSEPPLEEKLIEALENNTGDLGNEPFRIKVVSEISLNYVFAESPDSFVINYKVEMEGLARNKVDVIQSNGQIATDVQGFLSKGPTWECLLQVSVSEFPAKITFNRIAEDNCRLDIEATGDVLEKWESNCTFADAPGAKFNTIGNPETWVIKAFSKTTPPLEGMECSLDPEHKKETTTTFEIDPFILPDPPLGSVEIAGTGTITFTPEFL